MHYSDSLCTSTLGCPNFPLLVFVGYQLVLLLVSLGHHYLQGTKLGVVTGKAIPC